MCTAQNYGATIAPASTDYSSVKPDGKLGLSLEVSIGFPSPSETPAMILFKALSDSKGQRYRDMIKILVESHEEECYVAAGALLNELEHIDQMLVDLHQSLEFVAQANYDALTSRTDGSYYRSSATRSREDEDRFVERINNIVNPARS